MGAMGTRVGMPTSVPVSRLDGLSRSNSRRVLSSTRWPSGSSSCGHRRRSPRLRLDHAEDPEMRVSHETIYQSLFVQGRGELRRELALSLIHISEPTRPY